MIKGIRRSKLAEESSATIFQTTKLISSHFRREADKSKIFELINKEDTLKNHLIAACSVHIYHYLGVHTLDMVESSQVSAGNITNIEKMEKNDIINELSLLINDSIEHELNLMLHQHQLLDKILNKIIGLSEEMEIGDFDNFRSKIEIELVQILQKYPYIYFFDYIGNLIGYMDEISYNIIERASQFKAISKDLEKDLIEESKEDNYLEISLFKEIMNKIMQTFEFKNKKELETEAVPIKIMSGKILENIINKCPTSKRGLELWIESNKFSQFIISKFKSANESKINYEQFETNILSEIKDKIKSISLDGSSNNLTYFLEYLTDMPFDWIVEIFNKFGIIDIPEFIKLFHIDDNKFHNFLKMYGIDRMDLVKLSNPINCPLKMAESILLEIKNNQPEYLDLTISDLISNFNKYQDILSIITNKIGTNPEELKKLNKKKQLILEKVMVPNSISNFSSVVTLYDFNVILDNITREIFFSLFSKFTRQICRVLESYIKIKEDMAILLLAFKRINSTSDSNDEWVKIKIEELAIQRLMNRQKELALIFNSERDAFLVNGFILARFLESKLINGINILKNEPSMIFSDIKPISLPADIISPVSYCLAYDILMRYKEHLDKRTLQVENASIKAEQQLQIKKDEIRKSQEENTFNWIDKKISTSIMRITSKGINPTTLYWSDKDNSNCSDNMMLYSQLGENKIELILDFYKFALSRMKDNFNEFKIPNDTDLRNEITKIAIDTIANRLKKDPNSISEQEINKNLISGELHNITDKVASLIGKRLDKILYSKFKNSLK